MYCRESVGWVLPRYELLFHLLSPKAVMAVVVTFNGRRFADVNGCPTLLSLV